MLGRLRATGALLALPALGVLLCLLQSPSEAQGGRWTVVAKARPGRSIGYGQTSGKPQRVMPQNFDPEAIEKKIEGNPRMPILKEGAFVPYNPVSGTSITPRVAPRASSDPVAFSVAKLPANLASVNTGTRSTVHEPSVATAGNTAFYTANWYAARSADGGTSWTFVNPYTLFPNDAAGFFCCDQLVESFNFNGQDYFVWILQYLKNGSSENYYRVAWATPAQVAANQWQHSLVFSRSITTAGRWLDYPDLTVSSNNVYLSCNIFNASDIFQQAAVIRIPMSDLVNGGSFTFAGAVSSANASFRFAQGSTDIQYFASHNNTSSMRIFRWPESGVDATTIASADVATAAWQDTNYTTSTPDGFNWMARVDDRITAGAKAGNELWFGWTAGRGTQGGVTRSQPYVGIVRVNATTLAKIGDGNISSSSFAVAYPAFAPNSDGEVGVTCVAGGGSIFPTPQFGFVTGNTALATPNGFAGTHGPSEAEWGDYVTIHPLRSNPKLMVASNVALQGGNGGSFSQSQYVVFGRSGDVTPGTPSLGITSPNGGETWDINSQQTVMWSSSNVTGNVNLDISTTGAAGPWISLVANTANDGTESVTVPATGTTQARVRVVSVANNAVLDISDANFTIRVPPTGDAFEPDNTSGTAKTITSGQTQTRSIHVAGDEDWAILTIPAGGGTLVAETGGSNPTVDDTILELYASNGTTELAENDDITPTSNLYSRISSGTLAAGTYFLKARAFSAAGTILSYTLSLTITPTAVATLTLTSPNGGEVWSFGAAQTVTWTSEGLSSNIRIEISTDNGAGWIDLAGSVPNTGSRQVTAPTTLTTLARVRISSVSDSGVSDTSAAAFTISIPPDPFEVDDTRATAKVLANNQTQNRSIHVVGNQDYAKFTLTATRIVTLTTAGPEGDTVMELLNKSGSRLALNDDASVSTTFSRIRKKLAKGTYYVRIYEHSKGGFGNEAIPSYTLAMTQRKP